MKQPLPAPAPQLGRRGFLATLAAMALAWGAPRQALSKPREQRLSLREADFYRRQDLAG